MIGQPDRRRRVDSALKLAGVTLAALALLGCHQLTNPVDPNSTTYTGVPTESTPPTGTTTGPPALPDIDRWQILAPHGVDHWIGPTIPAGDDTYVEPRRPTGSPIFFLVAHFSGDIRPEMFDDGVFVWATNDGAITQVNGVAVEALHPENRTLVLRLEDPQVPQACRARVKLVDRNGHVAGDLKISFLKGDINQDGAVQGTPVTDPADLDALALVDGRVATASEIGTVLADVNASGVVEGAVPGDGDYDIVTGFTSITIASITFPNL